MVVSVTTRISGFPVAARLTKNSITSHADGGVIYLLGGERTKEFSKNITGDDIVKTLYGNIKYNFMFVNGAAFSRAEAKKDFFSLFGDVGKLTLMFK